MPAAGGQSPTAQDRQRRRHPTTHLSSVHGWEAGGRQMDLSQVSLIAPATYAPGRLNQRVLVMVMMSMFTAGAAHHLLRWHHASVHHFAIAVFKLDRRVADIEMFLENMVDLAKDGCAFGRRNVVDGHVAGQCTGLRTNIPDMQIMHVEHAGD